MKFKINDFVRILPENDTASWYTDEIFQIVGIEKSQLYIISTNLNSSSERKNTIFAGNVYQDSECKKRLRKLKMEQLNNNGDINNF